MDNINVIYMPMPATIGGYTIPDRNNDNFYTIVLNSNLCYERNLESYYHELKHIMGDDFEKDMHVNDLEELRH